MAFDDGLDGTIGSDAEEHAGHTPAHPAMVTPALQSAASATRDLTSGAGLGLERN